MANSNSSKNQTSSLRTWIMGITPLVLLSALVAVFIIFDPTQFFRAGFPPVEDLTFERVALRSDPATITLHLINGGADPVTISQVIVDEAYWAHEIKPDRTIPRLRRASIEIPYPWVEGEAHEIMLVSTTGVTFGASTATEAGVAKETDTLTIANLSILGFTVTGGTSVETFQD